MEKVSIAMVDDLTVGDAINLFSLHEAPYRPFLTYRARVALDGPLVASSGGTSVNLPRLDAVGSRDDQDQRTSPSGRIRSATPAPSPRKTPGPPGHFRRRNADEAESED
jgi:hypothetical protein